MNTQNRGWELNDAVEIVLPDSESFLKVAETLTRIGIANNNKKRLIQSCNILHKKEKYYICHFKVLFALDGKRTEFDLSDWKRQNSIAKLLSEWNMINIVNPIDEEDLEDLYKIKVIKYSDKNNWNLESKYQIGNT